jgi:phage gp29-like protein
MVKNRLRAVLAHVFKFDGEKVNAADLKQPQTAGMASLHREFQGHPTRGLTPSRLADILDAAEQGDLIAQAELYEDLEEKDGHILAEMGKRRRALVSLEWDVLPPDNPTPVEEKAAERLAQMVDALDDFEGMLFDITDAIGKGFACLELEWGRGSGDWLPEGIIHRPMSWFQLHRGFRQEIRLRGPGGGVPLQPWGWIVHAHRAKSGYLERSALFRSLVWPYLFKNYSIGDLAEFLESYGIPAKVGRYPGGATEPEKKTLLRALASLGRKAAGIIPQGMEIELLKAVEGDPGAFQLMITWCEATQSKVILGGTLTSGSGDGTNTNALGNVHNEVRLDLRDGDARQVARTISRDLLLPLGVLNGLVTDFNRCPRFVFDTSEPEDMGVYADALAKLVPLGMRVPRQWAQERLGIPEPQADEEVLTAPAPPAFGAAFTAANLAVDPTARRAALAAQVPTTAATETAVDRLDRNLKPVVDDWLGAIAALVRNADSLEQLRDGLAKLAPDMSLDTYAEAMAQALAAATLQGRSDILDQAGRRNGGAG